MTHIINGIYAIGFVVYMYAAYLIGMTMEDGE
jgi:hypothetical protein